MRNWRGVYLAREHGWISFGTDRTEVVMDIRYTIVGRRIYVLLGTYGKSGCT